MWLYVSLVKPSRVKLSHKVDIDSNCECVIEYASALILFVLLLVVNLIARVGGWDAYRAIRTKRGNNVDGGKAPSMPTEAR